MRTRLFLVSLGVAACLLVVWVELHHSAGRNTVSSSTDTEPVYRGHPLSYWTDHAFRYDNGVRTANPEAVEALQSMRREALPLLVKWISGTTNDYQRRAGVAFDILGPTAESAIPDLIKVIGRNHDYPASALVSIGSNSVPPLIELLTTNRARDIQGNPRRKVPENRARENAIWALCYMGTNAQAALPVLVQCCPDEYKRSRANVASALARVGAGQPEIVVPALTLLLTNSDGFSRFSAVNALRSFGSRAASAVSALSDASQSSDPQMQIYASFALKTIAPQTTNALAPLILNLKSKTDYVQREAFRVLEELGTNASEAQSTLLELARQSGDLQIRVLAIHSLTNLNVSEEEMLPTLRECLMNKAESVACAAAESLAATAEKSRERRLELLSAFVNNRNADVRGIANRGMQRIMGAHPDFIFESLNAQSPEAYYPAMQFLHTLAHESLVLVRYEPEPSTNYEYFKMKEIADKKLFQPAIPMLVKRLQDVNPDVRKLATNVLLELDPKAAKKAGVFVVPPYSMYAD